MTWTPSAALVRTLVVATVGLVGGVVLGDPTPAVLAAPFALMGVLALLGRPTGQPVVRADLGHQELREGQATVSRLSVRGADGVEQVTRVVAPAPFTEVSPTALTAPVGADGPWPDVAIRADRWGRRLTGDENVALFSAWGGFRWGPRPLTGSVLTVLPVGAPFDLAAEAPQPVGLVGPHRSRRTGTGTEFNGIRPFATGDRLRRIHWRESLRTGDLHVVTTRAEEDSGVLVVVDALTDLGRSGGVDGEATSLDLSVRAAVALTEQHLRLGDRVALRVLQKRVSSVPSGSGRRHLRRIREALADVVPGVPLDLPGHWRLGVPAGTVVYLLSPLLLEPVTTTAVALVRQGLPVVAVDTLPSGVRPGLPSDVHPGHADLAWRLRRMEREDLLARLGAAGVPVAPWHGPGTVDVVLRLLARRAARHRAGAR